MLSTKKKYLLLLASVILFVCITYTIILTFRSITDQSHAQHQQVQLAITLAGYILPIVLAWLALLPWAAVVLSTLATIVAFLTIAKTSNTAFLLFGIYYVSAVGLLWFQKRFTHDTVVLHDLEIEKTIKEKNILTEEYKKKNKALEIFLHKYADYANLRGVIEDFASTLSLDKICEIIVRATLNAIGKGEEVMLYIVDLDENSLSLRASKSIDRKRRTKIKKGDIFDKWVLKNIQQLMVNDITSDVRFDVDQNVVSEGLKSLMVTPLMYQSRVIGTLRLNSEDIETFSIEDLRVFSIIAGLASAALSNAILYQKTEELAIKDSLTGLFVHRYFKDRLKEEYKRALLTNTPLTLAMADLDNFKSYNDRYGHTAGDIILKKVSEIISSVIKEKGIVSRYGGEEFAILLPKVMSKDAYEDLETIREKVASTSFDLRGVRTAITISIGVASIPSDTLDSEELIKMADMCLYDAKGRGKNQVIGEYKKGDKRKKKREK